MWQPLKGQAELWQQLSYYQAQVTRPIEYPVIVDTWVYYQPPQKNRIFFTAKPDEDNLRKAILDGMVKAHLLRDDAYVLGGENFKMYDGEEHLSIKVFLPSLGYRLG